MKLKANVSFCGKVSAGAGQIFYCPDDVAADLISAGFADVADSVPDLNAKSKGGRNNEGKRDKTGKSVSSSAD